MAIDDKAHPQTDSIEMREISDARTMRALAHPVRLALIELLNLEEPLTATQAGERIGESPTTCSFHLRQLAKYGFVEEAGRGSGRARPWRLSARGMRFSTEQGDPETRLAAGALERMMRERVLGRYENWAGTRSSYPEEWRENAMAAQHVLWMTVDELKEFNEELSVLVKSRFRERLTDAAARPHGALPVELLIFDYPVRPGPGGDNA